MAEYRIKRPGDVLHLYEDLDVCRAGNYVLMSIRGDWACVSRLGENEDGHLCTTNKLVDIPLADLSLFQPIGVVLDLLP